MTRKAIVPLQNFCEIREEHNSVTGELDSFQMKCAAPLDQAYRCTFFKFKLHDTCVYMRKGREFECENELAQLDAMTIARLESI